jgi:hypothetical protein
MCGQLVKIGTYIHPNYHKYEPTTAINTAKMWPPFRDAKIVQRYTEQVWDQAIEYVYEITNWVRVLQQMKMWVCNSCIYTTYYIYYCNTGHNPLLTTWLGPLGKNLPLGVKFATRGELIPEGNVHPFVHPRPHPGVCTLYCSEEWRGEQRVFTPVHPLGIKFLPLKAKLKIVWHVGRTMYLERNIYLNFQSSTYIRTYRPVSEANAFSMQFLWSNFGHIAMTEDRTVERTHNLIVLSVSARIFPPSCFVYELGFQSEKYFIAQTTVTFLQKNGSW